MCDDIAVKEMQRSKRRRICFFMRSEMKDSEWASGKEGVPSYEMSYRMRLAFRYPEGVAVRLFIVS